MCVYVRMYVYVCVYVSRQAYWSFSLRPSGVMASGGVGSGRLLLIGRRWRGLAVGLTRVLGDFNREGTGRLILSTPVGLMVT